ncbi:MAG: hypothetical protein QM669_10340 [Siphonobacter sp.]
MEKFSIFRLRTWVKVGLVVVLVGIIIGFAENWYSSQRCKEVLIKIDETSVPLLTRQDVNNILTESGRKPLKGHLFRNMDLDYLESRVESNPLIDHCQISRNLRGSLLVEVQMHRPIARLVQAGLPDNGMDRYLNEKGRFMPLSERYTSRVVLLSGSYFEQKKSLRAPADTALLHLVQQIDQDSLWRAQIDWIEVDKNANVTLWPQVGNLPVEFGKATNRNVKFEKLRLFFKQILPLRGWNTFSKVSVQYRNQIVCTKSDSTTLVVIK